VDQSTAARDGPAMRHGHAGGRSNQAAY